MKQVTQAVSAEVLFDPFAGPEIARLIYTTESQAEIWLACLLGGEDASRAYNESISLRLSGPLHRAAMEKALLTLVQRHEALRAAFSADGRHMCVFEALPITLSYQDVSYLSAAERTAVVDAYVRQDARHLFNLVTGPLLKAGLIKVADHEHRLVLTAHHIVCDGWSLGVMLQEMGALYSAYVQNRTPYLPAAATFSAYADEQQALIENDDYQRIEQFWLRQYQPRVPELTLPTDFPRPAPRTYKSQRLDFRLEPALLAALKQTGVRAGCSFVTTLLAAFEVLLYQLTGQDELVVGLPAAGQSAAGRPQLVGHCVNLLPLRTTLDADSSFLAYLRQRKSALFDAHEHQQLTFGRLLKKLSVARDPTRIPLVPVVFNIDVGLDNGVDFAGLTYELISNPREYETFELFLNASGTGDQLVLEWSYNTALFKAATIGQMMAAFERVLGAVVADPTSTLRQLAQVDHAAAYAALNATAAPYPAQALPPLLAAQAQATPQHPALRFNGVDVSYQALHQQANRLAHYLATRGVRPGDTVAVALPRSPELVAALLAILQCGAAYLPLDPTYPPARLEFMLTDSTAQVLLTTAQLAPTLPPLPAPLLLEDVLAALPAYPATPLTVSVAPKDVAYLLYTSGSTGQPKGVRVTHRNLVNFLCSMARKPGLSPTDKLLSITTISFDIAGLELFLPLLAGATVVLADAATARDGRLLLGQLATEGITVLQATPTTWQMLLDAGWTHPLPLKALCGGEALPPGLARQLLSKCDSLWNLYGPTETTVWSAVKQVSAEDEVITIGRPIANTQLYILDAQDQLVAPGAVGEIGIAGDGVALGYWQRPELTAGKFVPNPFAPQPGALLYRTGDLGQLLPTGEVQCLGRVDQQVKIRGHRIEPGEVEQALLALPGVRAAVVLAPANRLVAYVVPTGSLPAADGQPKSWRQALAAQLPAHLVPQDFHLLAALPTTLNGKLDRQALLAVTQATVNQPVLLAAPTYTAPRTTAEQLVAAIWQDCLGLAQVDIFSNFFELGGHSLIAVQLMTRLEQQTGKRLPLAALFEYATIEKLAQLLEPDSAFITWDSLVAIKPHGTKPPLYIVHGAGLNVLIFNALARNMDTDQPIYGLQAKGLDGVEEPLGTVEEMAAHYVATITAANPAGPYALAGYSFGGIIAFEMARQLMAQGKRVKTLALLDTYVYPAYHHDSAFRKKIASTKYFINKLIYALRQTSTNKDYFLYRVNYTIKIAEQAYLLMKYGREKQHQLRYKQPLKLYQVNSAATNQYQLLPQPVKIDLFRVKNTTYYMHDTVFLGWKPFALDGVKVHEIAGDHTQIFSPPNDKESARLLQEVLNGA